MADETFIDSLGQLSPGEDSDTNDTGVSDATQAMMDAAAASVAAQALNTLQALNQSGPTDTAGDQYIETENPGTYIKYLITTPEYLSTSVLVFSVATSTRKTNPRVFRADADVSYRVIEWEAVRLGDWPQAPAVDESNGTLMYQHIEPLVPVPTGGDCKITYRLRGKYVYVLTNTKSSPDAINAAKLPYISPSAITPTVQANTSGIAKGS